MYKYLLWNVECHFLPQIEKVQATLQAVSEQKIHLEAELQHNIEMVRGCLWSIWCRHIASHVKRLTFCLCVWVNRKKKLQIFQSLGYRDSDPSTRAAPRAE